MLTVILSRAYADRVMHPPAAAWAIEGDGLNVRDASGAVIAVYPYGSWLYVYEGNADPHAETQEAA
jgi:hypothetical protein